MRWRRSRRINTPDRYTLESLAGNPSLPADVVRKLEPSESQENRDRLQWNDAYRKLSAGELLNGAAERKLLAGSTVTGTYPHKGFDIAFREHFAPDGSRVYSDRDSETRETWAVRDDGCVLRKEAKEGRDDFSYYTDNGNRTLTVHPGISTRKTILTALAGSQIVAIQGCQASDTRKNCEQAIADCMVEAESNDPAAQGALGYLHENELGVKKIYAQAAFWYEAASRQGVSYAQYNRAQLYRTGKAGIQDNKKVIEYYSLAAEQDCGEAQFSLGVMYFEGSGTPVNMEKARYWWSKARSNGIARAESALNRSPAINSTRRLKQCSIAGAGPGWVSATAGSRR